MTHVHNFGAGPSVLPPEVMEQVQREMLDFAGTGMSVLEVSHRSRPFDQVVNDAEARVRDLLGVPATHSVLFVQGGATTQFAAVWYNLLASQVVRSRFPAGTPAPPADYLVTGTWSRKAAEEVTRLGGRVNVAFDAAQSPSTGRAYIGVPPTAEWQTTGPRSRDAAYVYYCDNETVNGVEWDAVPDVHPDTVLVCDISSNAMSRPIDVARFGIIFAGAQKNMGPAGVTVVIVRNDLLVRAGPDHPYVPFPTMLDYEVARAHRSLYNTPPTFAIYVCDLVFKWIQERGGVAGMAERSQAKLAALTPVLDGSTLYRCPVAARYRSRMNVVLTLTRPELEAAFLAGAQKRGMVQLKGHRSVGGIRISLYNALDLASVQALAAYMVDFEREHTT
ncbi:Phosphoserine transaminase [Tieghemiomyces parasiticus]|uniref:Phosphoserine aminotransferase n=1 Tax=Tieghemiomyces parasiticus TaxID=78921 RepID=A0A9W8DWR5_9FUNG|nr:Phosphoserine transaminase [Tieghemiomyces parasiticus]